MIDGNNGLFLLPFLAAAAWYDWRELRIPNWVAGLGLAAAVAVEAMAAMAEAAEAGGLGLERAWAAAAGAVVLRAGAAVLLTGGLYALRMVGAGDIKLIAMIAGGLGFRCGGAGILAGLFLGAAWSFIRLVRSGRLMGRLWYFVDYVKRCVETGKAAPYYRKGEDEEGVVIPLGACIAVGSAAVVAIINILERV